jgi:hypothetical protein
MTPKSTKAAIKYLEDQISLPVRVKETKKMGRPVFNSQDEEMVLTKVKHAWACGATDEQAAFYAGISNAGLSRYQDSHPEVREYRNHLRENPRLQAKFTVMKNMDKIETAKWQLEKTDPEYQTKQKEESGGLTGINLLFQKVFNNFYDTSSEGMDNERPVIESSDLHRDSLGDSTRKRQ